MHTYLYRLLRVGLGVGLIIIFAVFFFWDGPYAGYLGFGSSLALIQPLSSSLTATFPKEQSLGSLLEKQTTASKGSPTYVSQALDAGRLSVQVPARLYISSQSSLTSSSQAFSYAGHLFEQLTHHFKAPDTRQQFQTVAFQAHAMARQINRMSEMRFQGPPVSDYHHLNIRSAILSDLVGLNQGASLIREFDSRGKLLSRNQTSAKWGAQIRQLSQEIDGLIHHPSLAQYPETQALLLHERELLRNIAAHLLLVSDGVYYTAPNHQAIVGNLKIRVEQTLPAPLQVFPSL